VGGNAETKGNEIAEGGGCGFANRQTKYNKKELKNKEQREKRKLKKKWEEDRVFKGGIGKKWAVPEKSSTQTHKKQKNEGRMKKI